MSDLAAAVELQPAGAVAEQINEQHRLAIQHRDLAIEHAVKAGRMLLSVKASMPHGEFLPWLQNNVQFTARTAQRYMAAAAPLPKYDSVSHSQKRIPALPRHKLTKSRQQALQKLDHAAHRDTAVAHVAWLVGELPAADVRSLRSQDVDLLKQLRSTIDGLLEGCQ
jgi:hypothetical protein